jgi:hypothetical protein
LPALFVVGRFASPLFAHSSVDYIKICARIDGDLLLDQSFELDETTFVIRFRAPSGEPWGASTLCLKERL